MYTSLRAASRTISHYVHNHLKADPTLSAFFAGGTMEVSLQSPPQMTEANAQGLSVWMYRVVRDEDRLNAPEQRVRPNGLLPPSLPLRVHYLMTPVSSETTSEGRATEQAILGKVLQLFNDRPFLEGADLADDFAGSDTVLRIRLEPLSLQEVFDIWDALDGSYRLSVSYEVSVVNIDPTLEPKQVSPVTSVIAEYANIVGSFNTDH